MTGLRVAAAVLLAFPLGIRPDPAGEKKPGPSASAARPAPDSFSASVRPVLVARCAPCHEPGGPMYDRMPFDKPGTISSQSAGVLKRLKGSDREAVERWLASLPAAK